MNDLRRKRSVTLTLALAFAAIGPIACGLMVRGVDDDQTGIHAGSSNPTSPDPSGDSGGASTGSGSADGDDAGSSKPPEPPCEAGVVRACLGNDGGVGRCQGATQTCGGDGKFGVCVGAQVAPETCNGIDDDCNGTNDDPCPTGALALGNPRTTSPVIGNASGGSTAYDDTCPAGEVLTGLSTRTNAYMRRIQGRCSKLTIVEDKGATPYTYTLTITAGATLPEHGTVNGTAQSADCPAGTVMIGYAARAGLLVDQITLRCASLTLTTGAGPSFGLTIGAPANAGTIGGTGGGAVPSFLCPSGTIIHRLFGKTGDGLDNFAVTCATISIPRKG